MTIRLSREGSIFYFQLVLLICCRIGVYMSAYLNSPRATFDYGLPNLKASPHGLLFEAYIYIPLYVNKVMLSPEIPFLTPN